MAGMPSNKRFAAFAYNREHAVNDFAKNNVLVVEPDEKCDENINTRHKKEN